MGKVEPSSGNSPWYMMKDERRRYAGVATLGSGELIS